MAQRYRQKIIGDTGLPPWEMDALEYTGYNLEEIQAWCSDVTYENDVLKLYGVEIPPTAWIIMNPSNNRFSPATSTFPQYHDPI